MVSTKKNFVQGVFGITSWRLTVTPRIVPKRRMSRNWAPRKNSWSLYLPVCKGRVRTSRYSPMAGRQNTEARNAANIPMYSVSGRMPSRPRCMLTGMSTRHAYEYNESVNSQKPYVLRYPRAWLKCCSKYRAAMPRRKIAIRSPLLLECIDRAHTSRANRSLEPACLFDALVHRLEWAKIASVQTYHRCGEAKKIHNAFDSSSGFSRPSTS